MKCLDCDNASTGWSLSAKYIEYGGPVCLNFVCCSLVFDEEGNFREVKPSTAVIGVPIWCPKRVQVVQSEKN